jgi:hypothetical protein
MVLAVLNSIAIYEHPPREMTSKIVAYRDLYQRWQRALTASI